METSSLARLHEHNVDSGKATENRVLELILDLEDPQSWLHRKFYGELGVTPTPLESTPFPMHGHKALLKNETAHILRLGKKTYSSSSFKRRGALLAGLLYLRANPRLKQFVTASHGNHGIGVAMAAKTLGVRAVVFCPESISETKLKHLQSLGAVVYRKGLKTFEDALDAAEQASKRTSTVLIHPFDQVEVIAGQATIGLEIVRELLSMSTRGEINLATTPIEIDVAVAGGGLLTGVSIVLKRYKDLGILGNENVRLYGAQMKSCDAARRSVIDLRNGGNGKATFAQGEFNDACDSTAVKKIGKLTLPFLADKSYVQGFRIVDEVEVGQSMQLLSEFYGKLIEPAGALAYAASRQTASQLTNELGYAKSPTVYIVPVCGANVTHETYGYFQEMATKAGIIQRN
jgi:threonine dehydratase